MADLTDLLLVLFLVGLVFVGYFVFASFAYGAGYQPAPRAVVRRMLEYAALAPGDVLYDLGAGTGAIVFRAAATPSVRVVGVEIEPLRVGILRLRRRASPARDRIEIRWGNANRLDLSSATVVTTFLWPQAMEELRPRFERMLRPGTRVVSHWHRIPGWTEERSDPELRVYLYRWTGREAS